MRAVVAAMHLLRNGDGFFVLSQKLSDVLVHIASKAVAFLVRPGFWKRHVP